MKKIKNLLSVLLVLCLIGSVAFTAFAAETDDGVSTASVVDGDNGKIEVDTDNNPAVIDLTHLDVKEDAKYYATVDGETVELDAKLDPTTIVVVVTTPDANIIYNFANYKVYTLIEDGRTEYRIILDGTDGSLLGLISWDGVSYRMNNVYVSARFVFEDVPEALAENMDQDKNGNYYVDVVNYKYTGIQECTSHNGLRSEGHVGPITGVDLYLGVVGMSVETSDPEQPTDPGETDPTDPGETDPTDPSETDPTDPGETDPTDPGETDPTNPGETDPTDPGETDPTNPGETDPTNPGETDPTDPGETDPTNPGETDPTEPGDTTPGKTDDVPDTGDQNMTILYVLLGVSFVGMVAALVIGNKLKYNGKYSQ